MAGHSTEQAAPARTTAYSIFQEPWWLDATAPGWQEVTVKSGGRVIGRLPFVVKRKRRLTSLEMPPLNQYLGPWMDPGEGKYVTQLTNQHQILRELIEQLPPFHSFKQQFAPNITNWLPFYWAGFEATVRYTYRIEDLSDLDVIWSEVRENIRREIRKAQRQLTVRDDLSIDRFAEEHAKTFERQSMKTPVSPGFIARMDAACREHHAGKPLFAVDSAERVHAVVYLVWSPTTCYYLLSGADPALRSSGATSLLVWEGIKTAQKVSAAFDFEGSMVPGIERFMRSFGARLTPYYRVTKSSRWVEAARSLQRAWGAVRAGLARKAGQ